jgi:hypothetical protein
MESIFSGIFERAEAQLNFRWISLRNDLNLPSILKQGVFQTMYTWAYQELSQLIILGGTSLNPGLPITDHQKAYKKQQYETDKKRAAAARTDTQALVDEQLKTAIPKAIKQFQGSLTPAAKKKGNEPPSQKKVTEPPPQPSTEPPPKAAAAWADSRKPEQKRHPLNCWADLCTSWKNTGECKKGGSCIYQHPIHPSAEGRCNNCGCKSHMLKDCDKPGGPLDPKKDEIPGGPGPKRGSKY